MLIVGFIVIQTVIFGIVFLILRKMLLKDTTSAVNRLKAVDDENAKRLDEMKGKIQEADAEYKRKTEALAAELARQREESKRQAEEERARIVAKAKEEAARVLESAKSRAEKVEREIEKGVQERAVGAAVALVGKALERADAVRSALHEALVDEVLREIEGWEVGNLPEETREVEIVGPRSLSPDRKSRIKEILEKKVGRELALKETLGKGMVGGLSLKLGSLVLDGTLENVLGDAAREMKKQEA